MDDGASEGSSERAIPLAVKLAYTLFVGVVIPNYWREYTPANFLWFCDVALLVTVAAIWLESPLLASMQAVGILAPQTLWVVDFAALLVGGRSPTGLSQYMVDASLPLYLRGMSLFHGWLPVFLLWLVWRLGYDRRAFLAQTLLCWAVLLTSFWAVTDANGKAGNVNKLFGPSDAQPQQWMPPLAWLGILAIAYPLVFFLPTSLVLRRFMPAAPRRLEQ